MAPGGQHVEEDEAEQKRIEPLVGRPSLDRLHFWRHPATVVARRRKWRRGEAQVGQLDDVAVAHTHLAERHLWNVRRLNSFESFRELIVESLLPGGRH